MRVLVRLYQVKQVRLRLIQCQFGRHVGHKEEAGFGIMGMQLSIMVEDSGSVGCVKRIQKDTQMVRPSTLLTISSITE